MADVERQDVRRFRLEFPRPLNAEYGVLQAHFLGGFAAALSESKLVEARP
ncbi:hypothetical protein [Frankia sp. Cj3]|nr:hypothetical protein [Frankia sp. Cj3]